MEKLELIVVNKCPLKNIVIDKKILKNINDTIITVNKIIIQTFHSRVTNS